MNKNAKQTKKEEAATKRWADASRSIIYADAGKRRSSALSSLRSSGGRAPAKSSGNLLLVEAWRLTLTTL